MQFFASNKILFLKKLRNFEILGLTLTKSILIMFPQHFFIHFWRSRENVIFEPSVVYDSSEFREICNYRLLAEQIIFLFFLVPFRSKKAGRFEKLLGFARSHSLVTRGSVSLSCASTPHPSCFSKSQRYYFLR